MCLPVPHSIPPVLRVKSGETVHFDCLDASNGQITEISTYSVLNSLTVSSLDPVNGPIFIESAQPGDILQVDVLDVETAPWGWTALIKGFGLLADEFPEVKLKIWDLTEKGFAWFDKDKGIKIPLRPFAGEMGTTPAAPGPHSTIPPYRTGGNIDTKHMVKGTTLYLPIECEGALFSIGVSLFQLKSNLRLTWNKDGHAAQGEGGKVSPPSDVFTSLTYTCRGVRDSD